MMLLGSLILQDSLAKRFQPMKLQFLVDHLRHRIFLACVFTVRTDNCHARGSQALTQKIGRSDGFLGERFASRQNQKGKMHRNRPCRPGMQVIQYQRMQAFCEALAHKSSVLTQMHVSHKDLFSVSDCSTRFLKGSLQPRHQLGGIHTVNQYANATGYADEGLIIDKFDNQYRNFF